MKGYLNDIKATEEAIRPGGWLYSGDVAYYDDQFRFYIVDRLKELIKVKGFQVAPAELEDVVRSHPKVLDIAVVGVEDEKRGEVPLAFVVKKPDVIDTEEDLREDIHRHVSQQLADYKQLAGGIRFTEAIPKSPSGKILRKDLSAMISSTNGR